MTSPSHPVTGPLRALSRVLRHVADSLDPEPEPTDPGPTDPGPTDPWDNRDIYAASPTVSPFRSVLGSKATPAVYPVVENPYLEDDPHSPSSASSSFVASPDPKETPTL